MKSIDIMSYNPPFHLFISGQEGEATALSGLFDEKLPCNRHNEEESAAEDVTCGNYFQAVQNFLSADDFRVLREALPEGAVPGCIHIRLEKHGEFYHPGRIEVHTGSRVDLFVVNVAVHSAGLACLDREYALLEKLGTGDGFVPRVFGRGQVDLSSGHTVKLFLAEWLEGYSEFHVSYGSGSKRVVVWDREAGNYYLEPHEVTCLYRKASRILTCFYNPITFEQVQPWHHAAGDFIVRRENGSVDVKLITVRQYTPFFEQAEADEEFFPEALLLFFINLSIRMRLDRADGVGETVWSDGCVVEAFVTGFLEGLKTKEGVTVSGISLSDLFPAYLKSLDGGDLLEYARMILDSWNPASPEILVANDNINDHVESLLLNIEKYC